MATQPEIVEQAPVSDAPVFYSTWVFKHTDRDAGKAFSREMFERFPFAAEDGATRLSAVAMHDVMSCADAARMVLESRVLDHAERVELAGKMLDKETWEDCLALAAEWDLIQQDGEFVSAPVAA